jgi:type I restriction enzyme R subunit
MKHREIAFEDAIELALIAVGGFQKGSAAYDAALALFPDDVLAFIQATQAKTWKALTDLYGTGAGGALIDALVKELASKTALTVLRHGFKCAGRTFRLAYFQPNTSMNPEAEADYGANRLSVYRQVHFSPANTALSVDVVLALNGLPVATLELKNPLTGQSAEHAKRQYKERSEREPLFKFKERALVHFAVDPDEAWMATRLAGKETLFLPFNKGDHHGAGNPSAPEGKYKTSYLWEEVLARDSLMDILARFLHLQVEERQVATSKGVKTVRKEALIFPRYHQLDAVRRLVADARAQGSGHNYLVQHSAGSGKSNSIAWLAHRLASLHADDKKVFDTVVVITDRRVLDQQLQNTVYQFEHKQGVVQKIDEDTQQLAKALSGGVPIVISTIQKFPFIAQAINTLDKKGESVAISTAGRRFAVIVDEAHSSQSGETAAELRRILNKDGIETAIAEQILDLEDEPLSEEAKKALLAEMLKRPRQPNISFFAFTATPKFKTLAAFNEPGPDGRAPFHLYSMRQAVEEEFIMDVLANYTTYKTYYGLIKEIAADPEVPRREAAKALARFMSLHPHNIAQKVEVIVEHFRTSTKHKIGGRAKAMVVTGSRLHAVRYKLAFDKYVKEKGYTGIRSLVAFSGSVNDPDIAGSSFTEVAMNDGIRETELPDKFAGEDYQVLLVAEKYQTGFDQPLLHTMYVDKRLAGVQAVQTLSRLNRIATGKEDTFVLDFVNEPADIYAAFKPYYEVTSQGEQPDPHQLYDLQHRLFEWQLFDQSEIDTVCEVWFKNRYDPTAGDHQKINATVDKAAERYRALDDEDGQDRFKGQLTSFRSLYGFLSQIIPYQDSDLEKLHTYARFLLPKLRYDPKEFQYRVEEDVALKFYRLQQISSGSIGLSEGEADGLKGPMEVGTRRATDDAIALSSLIETLNERFGTDFKPADQLFFDQVAETAVANEKLQAAAKVNKMEDFAYVFNRMLEGLFIERMEGNEDIFNRLMKDDEFRSIAASHLVQEVYGRLRKEGPQ